MKGITIANSFLTMAIIVLYPIHAGAQGCSDAGVCSLGSLGSGAHYKASKHALTIADNVGLSETKGEITLIFSSSIEGRFQILPRTHAALKISHQVASGKLATRAGFGNFILSVSHTVWARPAKELSLIVGGMIPPNRSDFTKNGVGLPMEYQSSLGSYEFLAGASLVINRWKLTLGYQHPFDRNENGFLHADWLNNGHALNYFESNELKRGDDLTFRIEHFFKLPRSAIFVSLLPIWRIQKDEIIKNSQVFKLDGSNQVTLNVNFTYQKPLSDNIIVGFILANPLLFRETRADGLTRLAVANLAFSYKF